ncbi:MAG: hypothetical protein ABJL44_14195 [Algibacter sp.]
MFKSKVLVGLILLLYVGFAIFELSGNKDVSFILDSLIAPTITLLYILFVNKKNRWFLLFLICYSFSGLMSLTIQVIIGNGSDLLYGFDYYIGNGLFILSYIFLVIKIYNSLSFKYVLKHLKVHLLVLIVLNTYLIYVLQVIVKPNVALNIDCYLEFLYNLVTFVLLSVALLNYFYRDNQKSLYLFLGTLCLVFSEMMDVAYLYISQISLLSFIATTLSLVAFYFFFKQAKLLNKLREENRFVVLEEQDSSSGDSVDI